MELAGYQKKYLRACAHPLKPVVSVGQKGLTPALQASLEAALARHELVKVKFVELKDRAGKPRMAAEMAAATGAVVVGLIGHTAIMYRRQPDPEKRRVNLPQRE